MVPEWAIKNEVDRQCIEKGYYWDQKEADKVRGFIERFCYQRYDRWRGKPPVLLPFQWEDIIAPLYSWKTPEGKYRFDTLLCFGPRKFGKTFLVSCLALYHLLTEPHSEIILLASNVKQARRCFENITGFCQHPEIAKRLNIKDTLSKIIDKKGQGVVQVLSSSPAGTSGWNSNFIAIDEICEWPDIHARRIYGRVLNSDAARSHSIKCIISTPQDNLESLGKELYDQAKMIINGEDLNPSILPVVYGADMSDPPDDPKVWAKHPAYNVIVTEDYYRREWERAKGSSHQLANFKTLMLGQWVGSMESFINPTDWGNCYENFKEEDLYGLPAVWSCDFGGKYDLLAWTILVPKDGKIYVLPRQAYPENVLIRKAKTEYSEYIGWKASGHIKTCPGDVIDREWFKELIDEDLKRFRIQYAAIDPFNMEDVRQWLECERSIPVIEVNTNTYPIISPLTLQFEKYVKDQTIRHNNNPVYNWAIQCMTVKSDDSNRIKPDKKSGRQKIDPVVSTIVGLDAVKELLEVGDWCGVV